MSQSVGNWKGVDRGTRLKGIAGAALEMITVGTVSAFVAVLISWDLRGGLLALVLGLLLGVSFLFAPAILSFRADVREYERVEAGTEREVTLADLRGVSDGLSAELRMLREEVAELRKPWWRRRAR